MESLFNRSATIIKPLRGDGIVINTQATDLEKLCGIGRIYILIRKNEKNTRSV
jgi:hypothetical protein